MTTPRQKRRPVTGTLGGIIVGFDQQIFRTMPPPHELNLKGRPVRGLSGQDGSELRLIFPDDAPSPSATSPSEPAPSEPESDPEP
jgi:hypothetical protein